jgi:hypothetical protein
MVHKPSRSELALVALSWAMLAFTVFAAFQNWSSTPR